MRRLQRLIGLWRRTSFSFKFATVILVAGGVIAVVPLLLAQANTRGQAVDRAADKVGIAQNLVGGQRSALAAFVSGVARQVAATHDLSSRPALIITLGQDVGVNDSGDVLGVIEPNGGVVALHGGAVLGSGDALLAQMLTSVRAQATTGSDADGTPWLISQSQVPGTSAIAFVARPVTGAFISAIDHNLATAADPADLVVVRDGRYAVAGTVAGQPVYAGGAMNSALAAAVTSAAPQVGTVFSSDVAIAGGDLGAGYSLVVTTPVDAVSAAWQPILLLLALILVAMCFIVIVVQTSLQRPLRRLDRAVAALGRGEFDVPVPTGSDHELSRLGATFEAMRKQLRATIRATGARAAVATELSSSQPLESALSNVCAELRRSLTVDAVLILVAGSEMNDPFGIVDGIREEDLASTLSGDGPIGEGFRYPNSGALVVGAAAASREAHLGVREFCVAPLRLGSHVHGVLGVANRSEGFLPSDADLVASTAEQVALALERYRFLAVVQRQASIDDLTGLYNHRFLVDYLSQQVALAQRLGAPLAILMLDIDHFKVLNDTHGHQAGDTALAAFAQTLTSSVRRSDLAARYGGEEFAVVMANTTVEEARLVAEKIRTALGETTIEIGDQPPISVTVSIGGAAFPEDTDSASELLSLADEALYRAKRAGRDRTMMAADTRRRGSVRRPSMKVVHTAPAVKTVEGSVGAGGRRRSSQ